MAVTKNAANLPKENLQKENLPKENLPRENPPKKEEEIHEDIDVIKF